mgnify:CR=1 FL=1
MAISIDTVYQKVLALANKEQRGYITPQEFNLFADQAQKEIFEQYFYDLNQFRRIPGNNTVYSDMINNLEEKISLFERFDQSATVLDDGRVDLSMFQDFWRLTMVRVDYQAESGYKVAEEMQLTELNKYNESPLGLFSKKRPVYTRYSELSDDKSRYWDRVRVYPNPSTDETVDKVYISYIRTPQKPNWNYFMVEDKPFFANDTNSEDFELHPSEESELVYRILTLAGISIEKPQLVQAAVSLEGAKVQQEKQ